MNQYKHFLLASVAASTAVASSTPVPQFFNVRLNEHNIPIIMNATIPELARFSSSFLDVVLTMHEYESTYVYMAPPLVRGLPEGISIYAGDEFLGRPRGGARYRRTNDTPHVMMGIGMRSHLGGVSLLKNESNSSGVLVVNDFNLIHFMASCHPDSVSVIPLQNSRNYVMHIFEGREEFEDIARRIEEHAVMSRRYHPAPGRSGGPEPRDHHVPWVSFGLESQAGMEPIITTTTGTSVTATPLYFWSSNKLVSLPSDITDQIFGIIAETGGVVDELNHSISNCNPNLLRERMPYVTLAFAGAHALLRLLPDDYLVLGSSDECQLNFKRTTYVNAFNPLALKNVNVHISGDNELRICDSIL